MESSTILPAAIASIANRGPVYTSPPTKISGSAVCNVTGSALAVLLRLSSTFVPSKSFPHSIDCPMDSNTFLHGTVMVSFSTY